MARTKEFNPDEAVQSALEVFWRLGYERTSLNDLLAATGIARQSLYDTFGDKHKLYIQALKRYRDHDLAATRDQFAKAASVKEAFASLLFKLTEERKSHLERGCLLLNANIERDSKDEELHDLLHSHQKSIESIFRDAIERAQKSGEITPKKDATALARFFYASVQGLHAVGQLNPKRKALHAIAETALTILN